MNEELQAWRARGSYLPDILKDFHDQKEVFKAMHELLNMPSDASPFKIPSWVDGQVYVIDFFLWFMARYGYTLQKSRAKQEFESLPNALEALRKHRNAKFAELLTQSAGNGPTPGQDGIS